VRNFPQKPDTSILLGDIRRMIEDARTAVAAAVNARLTMLYWHIGKRVREGVLNEKRAQYGKEIVVTLSRQLVTEYGNGYSEKNLRRMIQFANRFPDERIVATLSRELSWSHFISLIPLNKPLQRDFYAEMCRMERWNVRTLQRTATEKTPFGHCQCERAIGKPI
jgi:hypothetical protein